MGHNEKFNEIMAESDDRVLCVKVHKPISKEGYNENFINRLRTMTERHGEIRLLVYFADFKGWEPEAALDDMAAALQLGSKFRKLALVNPPEKNIMQFKFKRPLFAGEARFFGAEDLDEAIAWVKE